MLNIDLTPLFQAVIALLAALITARLIPWIKSKTNANQQESLITAARIAVLAAEQVFGSGQGREKLRYALDALKKAGFNLDETIAAEAIEKAVRDLNLFKQFSAGGELTTVTDPVNESTTTTDTATATTADYWNMNSQTQIQAYNTADARSHPPEPEE